MFFFASQLDDASVGRVQSWRQDSSSGVSSSSSWWQYGGQWPVLKSPTPQVRRRGRGPDTRGNNPDEGFGSSSHGGWVLLSRKPVAQRRSGRWQFMWKSAKLSSNALEIG